MIDPAAVGRSFGPFHHRVERERISLLAAALGENDPVFHDPAAARAAGHPDLPAPPTLATCYGLWANQALLGELAALGAPLPRLLHGEQRYQYHAPVHAGDELTSRATIVAVEPRAGRSGSFTLLTLETRLHNQRGDLAIVDRLVVVVREDERAGEGG